ncbi:ATP-binding cassette domain-containing protein [Streptomyces roseoverticillatus]|nr:ATP-binding cassette domain-containing protein [Streptomyces roseoverticillatus]
MPLARPRCTSKQRAELPQRLATLLARELFGGVTLSGGQGQRHACARALHRQSAVLVLDEPASEMNARGEHSIFTERKKVAAHRIPVVVTHPLDNTRIAGQIAVMGHGRIADTPSDRPPGTGTGGAAGCRGSVVALVRCSSGPGAGADCQWWVRR